MRHLVPLFTALCLILVSAGITAAGDGQLSPELLAVRAAVARYHSVDQALAAGYFAASPCVQSPAGAMGIHFENHALFGPGLNPATPEILLYMPNAAGELKLVGVEYWKADADQNLATDSDRPSLFGRGFDGPMLGHNPQMPIHYDLHVWVAEKNPTGVLQQWNPAISCP